ncbi:MAG: LysR family transcriptional regulator [Chloroflexi bacterium]|nr:LysR family transcriptional regulator [Chloroflexota bacterium]
MNIAQLSTFVAVVETGSLTSAARRTGVTQPGVTRQMQRLEAELGVALLERLPTGVRATREGEQLLTYAQEALSGYGTLLAAIQDPGAPLEGRLRIIASTTPGEYLVPELATGFSDRHPAVTTEVFVADTTAVIDEMLERRWDIGFVGRPADHRRLACTAVATDEVVLAVPANHALARKRQVSLADLAGERIIEREGGSGTRLTVQDELDRLGLKFPAYVASMVLGSAHAIVSAVDAGLGVGFVTARALKSHDATRVTAVRLADARFLRRLYMVHEKGRPLPRVVRAFRDHVLESRPVLDDESATES